MTAVGASRCASFERRSLRRPLRTRATQSCCVFCQSNVVITQSGLGLDRGNLSTEESCTTRSLSSTHSSRGMAVSFARAGTRSGAGRRECLADARSTFSRIAMLRVFGRNPLPDRSRTERSRRRGGACRRTTGWAEGGRAFRRSRRRRQRASNRRGGRGEVRADFSEIDRHPCMIRSQATSRDAWG